MRFAFIAKHRNIWPVAWLCNALDVSRSGFHAWLIRSPSARSWHDEVLVTAIDRSFKSSYRTYGARRVWHDVLAEGSLLRPASHREAHASERATCPAAASWTAERHRRASRSVGQYAPDQPAINANDPESVAFVQAIGAEPGVVLAPE